MKASTKFKKIFYKFPERARANLLFEPYSKNPMKGDLKCHF